MSAHKMTNDGKCITCGSRRNWVERDGRWVWKVAGALAWSDVWPECKRKE